MSVEEIGQSVGGVWLPKTEVHLVDMMLRSKTRRTIDGKATYQFHKLEYALQQVRQFRTAIDIGAHVGLWSMHLVKRFAAVEAFEPVPLHQELFAMNVRGDNVVLHTVALGDTPGVVDIEVPDETTGNAHVAIGKRHPGTKHVDHPDRQQVTCGVPVVTLDSFGFADVDFIKIDVEGYELAVIRGAEETIKRCRPVLVVEQKGNESAYGHATDAASVLLRSWGMKILRNMSGDHIMGW